MKKYFLMYMFLGAIIITVCSCKKSTFLDAKPDNSLLVPQSISDFQALLDNDSYMNGSATGIVPSLTEASTDDSFIFYSDYSASLLANDKTEYTWNARPYPGTSLNDWNFPYRSILYSNIVITGLANIAISVNNQKDWNNAEGSALFFRAHNLYQLAQVFAAPYDSTTAKTALGVPLRLGSDVSEKITRATLQETYEQIITDLTKARFLLPNIASNPSRPTTAAVYGLLARTYQTVGDYKKALLYADSCLQLKNSLIDYNSLSNTSAYPIGLFNTEVIFHAIVQYPNSVVYGYVDTTLFRSYNKNDLRTAAYFKINKSTGYYKFNGNYTGNYQMFGGIATDEIYLIRAECNARLGNVSSAMQDLNILLAKRWVTGTFTPFSSINSTEALAKILL